MSVQCPDVCEPGSMVYPDDINWPLIEVRASEQFVGGVDYSGVAQASAVVEVDGVADYEEGEEKEVEDAVDITSPGGAVRPDPAQSVEEWGLGHLLVATATYLMALAAVYAATSTQPVAPTVVYVTTSPGIVGPATAYVSKATELAYPAHAPHAEGPSIAFDPMIELLDGGGGDFSDVL